MRETAFSRPEIFARFPVHETARAISAARSLHAVHASRVEFPFRRSVIAKITQSATFYNPFDLARLVCIFISNTKTFSSDVFTPRLHKFNQDMARLKNSKHQMKNPFHDNQNGLKIYQACFRHQNPPSGAIAGFKRT
jgi:hypothetical protein